MVFKSVTIRKRSLLIGLISLTTMGCFFWGLAVYSSWLESSIRKTVHRQVVDDNIQTAKQLVRMVQEMGIKDIQDHPDSWERLQNVVEDISLPNDGFVCVVDSRSGRILCHPAIRKNPGMREMAAGKSSINVNGFRHSIVGAVQRSEDGVAGGIARIDGETQVVAAAEIPNMSANVLVHQRQYGIDQAVARVMAPVRAIGACMALLVTFLIATVHVVIIRRYENRLAGINERLEDTVRQRTRSLIKTRNAIIFGLAKLAESRDTDTGHHLERIRSYVTILANRLRRQHELIDEEYIERLALASSLHDIGKVGIPDQVLLKPGRFTPEERHIMEQHSMMGGDCLQAIQAQLGDDDFLALAAEIAYFHHERWDGTGYPFQKAEQTIPLSARIVALADVYDALTSKRPYKDAMSHDKARTIILDGRASHFDPAVVDAFVEAEQEFRVVANAAAEEEATLSTVAQLCDELKQRHADTEMELEAAV